ncbi:Uncharacterised protein [uncultured archaeon]|nr:Uncharacterised protein [uncultured archaeon]
MFSKLVEEFQSGQRLADLSIKHHMKLRELKESLRTELGNTSYLKTIRSNGAKAIIQKLKDPTYRLRYTSKMSIRVKTRLKELMKDPNFRKEWIKKAKHGSIKGEQKILELLNGDEFYNRWCAKCKLGGATLAIRQRGIHGASVNSRRRWSLSALKQIHRGSIGPNGEKMYNWLEVYVASVLQVAGFDYKYERIFKVKNRNGYVSVDFSIKQAPNLLIEATCWDDPEQKSNRLNKKFYLIKNEIPDVKMIVVTTRNRAEEYTRYLRKGIKVLTPIQFRRFVISKLAG